MLTGSRLLCGGSGILLLATTGGMTLLNVSTVSQLLVIIGHCADTGGPSSPPKSHSTFGRVHRVSTKRSPLTDTLQPGSCLLANFAIVSAVIHGIYTRKTGSFETDTLCTKLIKSVPSPPPYHLWHALN